ncbi:esterase/lipase family protein [Alkalimarinus coralli]|uniref:esterase/lipase family protein n=1 Tax=Alkalimarinus coralli TaxID=2935863 RepID=UPI00202AF85E|nr:hypothetical protein [Alkalimarinus coralli]
MKGPDNRTNKSKTSGDYRHWANVGRAVLNGVVGDYLVEQKNPLAIDMGFYDQGAPLSLPNPDMELSNKVVVLLHGLTNLETIWDIDTPELDGEVTAGANIANYGIHLQRDFGYTPLFLRYNTGLPIEENGRQFAQLMEQLIPAYPQPIDEIVLVGFSMGGLLMRYAQKFAIDTQSPWINKLTHCFYLGTPHEGSYFERFGHLASSVVRAIPKDYINHWANWIDLRSEGIQDLKHGLVHLQNSEQDGSGIDRAHGNCGSYYQSATHHFISGSLSAAESSLVNKVFGDILVTQTSANPEAAPESSKFAHFEGIPHIPLAHNERVYQQIKQWILEADSSLELTLYGNEKTHNEITPKVMLLADAQQSLGNPWGDKQEMLAGTLDLMAVGYEKTVEAVEKVHLSIAREPHVILEKVPVVKNVSGIVDTTHTGISDVVYSSIKQGGTLLRAAADLLKRQ